MVSIPVFTRIATRFFLCFIIISFCGYFIIAFNIISAISVILFITFCLCVIVGSYLGSSMTVYKSKKRFSINIPKFLGIILLSTLICTIIGWIYIISYYSSFEYVFSHGMLIRTETIGDGLQLKPTTLSYFCSIGTIGLPLSLAMYYYSRYRLYLWYAMGYLFVTVLGDLQTFGRIGILFCIFTFIAYLTLCIKRISYLKIFLGGGILFLLLMLPKYIRSGFTFEGIASRYSEYLNFQIPNVFDPLLSVYSYYFSGIYAFDYLLHQDISYEYGLRNFSAVYNLLNRIFEFQEGRNSIISDVAYVPFDTNIYTIAGELYIDGGLFALIGGSLLFGFICGALFKYSGVFGFALKLILLSWLFETPIYNVFSFGGFFLSFILMIILTLFYDPKNFNNHCKLYFR